MGLFESALLEIEYTSRKKTIAIQVEHNIIRILAPKRTSKKFINKLISKRKIWITKKLEEKERIAKYVKKDFVDGENILFLGKEAILSLVPNSTNIQVNKRNGITYLDFGIPTNLSKSSQEKKAEYIKKRIIEWYKNQAESLLIQRTEYYADQLGVNPIQIKIKHYKSRWGCCSIRNEIFYNWKIIMAPQEIIDYLVVHELCHILEHNHSNRYWGHVARMDEDYRKHRDWLKTHGSKLEI